MTKNEKKYIKTTLKDKKEEIVKCLNHYKKENDQKEINFFEGQLSLIKELENEYFSNIIE